jgi:acyl transferase domain-containing protein
VAADDLAFFEAHGTGTSVGDPIETAAIGAALAQSRSRPLPVGSVKSNVGHLEPASGLAGLLKSQLALEHRLLPATLGVETPNPAIALDDWNLMLATDATPLAAKGRLAAGVNSFGFGGANAHVVIATPDEAPPGTAQAHVAPAPLVVSAATTASLRALVADWRATLESGDDAQAAAMARHAAYRGPGRARRLVIPAIDRAGQIAALRRFEAGEQGGWAEVSANLRDSPIAFVFAGNGAQWPGMGVASYAADPAFRDSMDATAALVVAEGGPDVVAAMHAPDLAQLLSEAQVAQPLLMSLQLAIVDALAARGVAPAAVAGHSVGEVAAACVAGVMDRRAAAQLTVRRALRQAPLYGCGAMAAVLASAHDVSALIADADVAGLDIAADNSPRGVTLTGQPEAIDAFIAAARKRKIAVRRLKVDYPFHGPIMERIREGLLADLRDFRGRPTAIPFVSTTTGDVADGDAVDGAYWWRNARQPVLFRQAVGRLADLGARVFVEIGPQPTLQNYVTDTLSATGVSMATLPSLRRQGADAGSLDLAALRVAAAGGAVDRAAMFGPPPDGPAETPAYPWSLAPFRIEPTADALNAMRRDDGHPILGWRAHADDLCWRSTLDAGRAPWLRDHAVDGAVTAPAALFVDIAAAAASEALGTAALEVLDLDILAPLTLSEGSAVHLRTTIDAATGAVRIESRPLLSDGAWTLHAAGSARRLAEEGAGSAEHHNNPAGADAGSDEGSDAPDAALYGELEAMGLQYGPAFRRVRRARCAIVDGRPQASASLTPPLAGEGWRIDPTALDAAFHLVAAALADEAQGASPRICWLPTRAGRVTLRRPGATVNAARATILRRGERSVQAEVALLDASGEPIVIVRDMRFTAMRLRRAQPLDGMFWRQRLIPVRLDAAQPSAPPAAWMDPAARLAQLGCALAHAPEPDDAAMIAEAMTRRVLWDAAMALAPDGGVTLRARAALSTPAARALKHGLQTLVEDGAYDAAADRVIREPPAPPLDTLAAALLQVAPDRPELLLNALRLKRALSPGAELDDAPAGGTVDPGPAWRALEPAARDLAATWPAGSPFAVLLVGRPTEAVRQAFARADVAVVDTPPETGAYDVVMAAGCAQTVTEANAARCANSCARGGVLLAARIEDELVDALLRLARAEPRAAEPSEPTPCGFAPDPARRVAMTAWRAPAESGASNLAAPGSMTLLAHPADAEASALAAALRARGAVVAQAAEPEGAEGADTVVVALSALSMQGSEGLADAMIALRQVAEAPGVRRIWLLAPGGLAPRSMGHVAAAALARARRVFANEYAGRVAFGVLDADAAGAAALLTRGVEMDAAAGPELASRDGAVLAPRVAPAGDAPRRAVRRRPDATLALECDALGGLETLRWRDRARRAPGQGEIEIAVAAAGLNFRDVMWAMGALPEEAVEDGFAGARLGMECAGVVCRAGPGSAFREGDAVIAFAAGALAGHATVADHAAAPAPVGVPLTAAATMPVVFGTAWRGLIELGRLQRGETALVHGGAGGVGLAALQIARARGAAVIATAGSPEKRALATLLGATHVLDSRTLGFADAVMTLTEGRGADVVLNSLSGEAMARSLACVAAFGRFVELGKRDYYANTAIGLRPMRRNISYFGVDLDALLKARPEAGGQLLRAVSRGAAEGDFAPLPHSPHDAENAIAAFRLMQRSGHVGKIVLTPPDAAQAGQGARGDADIAAPFARADGAYLIVGGARGLGLKLAERLARGGARRLWLTSRSGDADPAALGRLRAMGVGVETVACDAADETAMRALLKRIDAAGAPLRGVALTAMVLDDGALASLNAARITAVLRPKAQGAVVLDALTRGRDLDFFVLTSSVSTLFGNPGQAAYVAANAAMEALAAARRAEGLPALAIGFGPISDVGVLADDETARRRMERRGAGLIDSETALDALEAALAGAAPDDAALTAAPMRWSSLARDVPVVGEPLFAGVDRAANAATETSGEDLAAIIGGLDDAAAVKRLAEVFRAEAAIILRQPIEEIDPSRPLADLGFDSLMGMELKLSAEEKHGLALPALALGDGATLAGVAARIVADARATNRASGEDDATLSALASRHLGEGDASAVAALQAGGAARLNGRSS